jgi:UDP-N-acetylglucosamine 3-dehydrogenase
MKGDVTVGPWRALLVGAGRMGKNHLRVLTADARFRVAGVVDPHARALPGRATFASVADVDVRTFDCVVIAAPTAAHGSLARWAIERDKPVLVEKPLAEHPEECLALVAEARARGVPLAVGHLERFNPALRRVAQLLAAGRLGEPRTFAFRRVGDNPARIASGANVLLELAVHDLDALRLLAGPFELRSSVCRASGREGVFEAADLTLASRAGPTASVHVDWVAPHKSRTLTVTGSAGTCLVDLVRQRCRLGGAAGELDVEIAPADPLEAQLGEVHALLCGQPSEVCSGEDAAAAVALADKALRMAQRARKATAGVSP